MAITCEFRKYLAIAVQPISILSRHDRTAIPHCGCRRRQGKRPARLDLTVQIRRYIIARADCHSEGI